VPAFRQYQASRDRQYEQLRQQMAQEQAARAEVQQQMAELQLANADPEEVAAYYQRQASEMRATQERQRTAAQERMEIVGQAQQLLEELGLSAETEGLEWGEEPSWEGLARLAASAAKVKALQAQAMASESGAVATGAAQAAKVKALKQAGVTKVSTATGAATPSNLQAEYEAEKGQLSGTGDMGAFTRLKAKYREQGLEV